MTHFWSLSKAFLHCRKQKLPPETWLWLSWLSQYWELYFNMKWWLRDWAMGTGLSNLYKWGDVVNAFYSREVGAKCLSQQRRQTVSQHKEIMCAAAFCMHILEANMHLSKLEKSNLQWLRPQTKHTGIINLRCLHEYERQYFNKENLWDFVVP